MPSFTVQTIIDRAVAIADMSGNFVTPAQWLAWYNSEARALEFFIARSGWVGNLAATVDAAAVSAPVDGSAPPLVGSIPAADYPLAVIGAYEVRDKHYRPLTFKNQVDFTRQSMSATTDIGDAREFAIFSNTGDDALLVHFWPAPTTGTYRILYLQGRTPAVAVTTSVVWPLGWEERIVLGMARKALIKEESDPGKVERLMGEQDAIIEEFCWNRNFSSGPQIRNVDRVTRGWTDQMIYGPYESWYWM